MEYERLLKFAGRLGLYQVIVFMCLGLVPMYYSAELMYSNFASPHHEHTCMVEHLQNLTFEEQRYVSSPWKIGEEGIYDSCKVFDLAWDNFTMDDLLVWNRSHYQSAPVYTCSHWVFQDNFFKTTVSSKVCIKFVLTFTNIIL